MRQLLFLTIILLNPILVLSRPIGNFKGMTVQFKYENGEPAQDLLVHEYFIIRRRNTSFCFLKGNGHAFVFGPGFCNSTHDTYIQRGDVYKSYAWKSNNLYVYKSDHNGEIKIDAAYLGALKNNETPMFTLTLKGGPNFPGIGGQNTFYSSCRIEAYGIEQLNQLPRVVQCTVSVYNSYLHTYVTDTHRHSQIEKEAQTSSPSHNGQSSINHTWQASHSEI